MVAREPVMDGWSILQAVLIFNAVLAFLRFGIALAGYGDGDALELFTKGSLWAWVAMLRYDLRRAGQ